MNKDQILKGKYNVNVPSRNGLHTLCSRKVHKITR